MKKLLFTLFLVAISLVLPGQSIWSLSEENYGIILTPDRYEGVYSDHIEMSGEQISVVLRWGLDDHRCFISERSLVFPMLRTLPNNTHASLMHRIGVDIPSLISVNGHSLQNEKVSSVEINGYVRVRSTYAVAPRFAIEMDRFVFPSVKDPLMGEIYNMRNISDRSLTVYIPEFSDRYVTLPENGVTGSYIIRADMTGCGTFLLNPGDVLTFGAVFQAYPSFGEMMMPNLKKEFEARCDLISHLDANLVLDTPDEVIDREFRFAKIRASESIYKTAGGYMHGPGGESYYAAIWANDQAEYVNPFFPFEGYPVGNESALNAYRHFARFMNDAYKPLPSSIIAEGKDIWNGAGDRGDAAMIAYGACRYALARGVRSEAEELWPLIVWCLEYCDRQLNEAGVVRSDTDELEGRFPSGDANLCTSTLYYDALCSAAMLSGALDLSKRIALDYYTKAKKLAIAIENYFGAEMGGYHTYRYYEGNTLLRSWICMPLIVGLKDRAAGTIAALTSPALLTEDGLLTEQGSTTFWDRSTLYALRGIYIAGDTECANNLMHHYSMRRLLGTHVPYPIEAYPEGSQRHLSAESGLYCRAVLEGMFGIRPTGFNSFTLTPRLAEGWDRMALNHVRAFNSDFDIHVNRVNQNLVITINNHMTGKSWKYKIREGSTVSIKL